MIIDDFDFGGISRHPDETDTVLVVNADGVLSFAVIAERFEGHSVTGKIGKRVDGIQDQETAERNPLDISELAARFFVKDLLCFGATERGDHRTIKIRTTG